jgi:glycyl-tRNA synthetase
LSQVLLQTKIYDLGDVPLIFKIAELNLLPQSSRYSKVIELAKRRGFFWPAYEIYGGVGGLISFGPLGKLLKLRVEEKWRRTFVTQQSFFEIESPTVAPGRVFKASGHVDGFVDKMVQCMKCGRRYRADHLLEEEGGVKNAEGLSLDELGRAIKEKGVVCPECGGQLNAPTLFNLMFKTAIGPYVESVDYLRPEAAQGMFTDFERLREYARDKLPFGAAQIGHVLRNEISPRQGPIRLREFTIMELELFFDPEKPQCDRLGAVRDVTLAILSADSQLQGSERVEVCSAAEAVPRKLVQTEWLAYFMGLAQRFLLELGVPSEDLRFREKLPWERAHYASQLFDLEVKLDQLGWIEVAGFAYRTDYDLRGHMRESGEDLRVFEAYPEPVERRVKRFRVKKELLGPLLKDDAARVFKALEAMGPDEIERSLADGYVMCEGHKIPSEHFEAFEETVIEKGRRFIPHVVEPSFGAERLVYSILEKSYSEKEDRVVLKLPKDLAPVEVEVFPLVERAGLPGKAMSIYRVLLQEGLRAEYDDSGSIGRRYARADEIGVPVAVTVDHRSLEDETVTLRDRDSWRQVRVPVEKLPTLIREHLRGALSFEDLGPPV